MIDKDERRRRIVEDFKKIFPGDENAVKFAENIPNDVLDGFEKKGFSAERKVKIDECNMETIETLDTYAAPAYRCEPISDANMSAVFRTR